MEKDAVLLSIDNNTRGLPKPEIPLHTIDELEDHSEDSHALPVNFNPAELSKIANEAPKQEILMLPVSGEFVSVNFDNIGKSEFHDNAVAPLDCCTLAVTNTAFA
jgi:hypothetical protein